MDKVIRKDDINKWLYSFDKKKPLYEVDVKIMLDPYIYHDIVDEFIKYAYENNWISTDYQLISDEWNKATAKIVFIKQLNVENILRLIAWHIRGERFCSGLLANAFDQGYIQTALERLQKI